MDAVQLQPQGWACDICSLDNIAPAETCVACNWPRSEDQFQWGCRECTCFNSWAKSCCEVCLVPRLGWLKNVKLSKEELVAFFAPPTKQQEQECAFFAVHNCYMAMQCKHVLPVLPRHLREGCVGTRRIEQLLDDQKAACRRGGCTHQHHVYVFESIDHLMLDEGVAIIPTMQSALATFFARKHVLIIVNNASFRGNDSNRSWQQNIQAHFVCFSFVHTRTSGPHATIIDSLADEGHVMVPVYREACVRFMALSALTRPLCAEPGPSFVGPSVQTGPKLGSLSTHDAPPPPLSQTSPPGLMGGPCLRDDMPTDLDSACASEHNVALSMGPHASDEPPLPPSSPSLSVVGGPYGPAGHLDSDSNESESKSEVYVLGRNNRRRSVSPPLPPPPRALEAPEPEAFRPRPLMIAYLR